MSALFATLTLCIIDLVQFNLVKLLQFRPCYDKITVAKISNMIHLIILI